jgi:hypothetical protein
MKLLLVYGPLSSSTWTSDPTVNDGSSLTGSTVIDTVAGGESAPSDVAVNVKPSDPLKVSSGEYVHSWVHVLGVCASHTIEPVSDTDPWLGCCGVNTVTASPDASIASSSMRRS